MQQEKELDEKEYKQPSYDFQWLRSLSVEHFQCSFEIWTFFYNYNIIAMMSTANRRLTPLAVQFSCFEARVIDNNGRSYNVVSVPIYFWF